MKTYSFLILISLLSFTFSLITKYGSEKTSKGIVVFDAGNFVEGEDMYFKIEALKNSYSSTSHVRYYYSDNNIDVSRADFSASNVWTYTVSFSSTENYTKSKKKYVRKFFTIKKQSSEFGASTNGNYIVMQLPMDSGKSATVTNTTKDKGKLPNWAVAVIVVVIVIIAVVAVVCTILKRKKMQQAKIASNLATANYAAQQNYQNQAIQAEIYQNQVAQAQAEAQAYHAQAQAQAYQDQMYQNQMNQAQYQTQGYQGQMNQPYPQQNYQAPVNPNEDVGYSSKAVM